MKTQISSWSPISKPSFLVNRRLELILDPFDNISSSTTFFTMAEAIMTRLDTFHSDGGEGIPSSDTARVGFVTTHDALSMICACAFCCNQHRHICHYHKNEENRSEIHCCLFFAVIPFISRSTSPSTSCLNEFNSVYFSIFIQNNSFRKDSFPLI